MPIVSIVVPCYNEQSTIRLLLDAIRAQTYQRDEMEVILADGMSTDGTREEVVRFQHECSDLNVRVIDNPKRSIPAALNRALETAAGDYFIRLDAHSMPSPEYIERCISDLKAGFGEIVGGVWEIRPGSSSLVARAIAVAAAHPLGVGDALYRYTTRAGLVDTVPFGAFHRSVIEKIGRYDESLLTNEDYEFNTRLRLQGGRVWLDPEIHSVYFARANLIDLARQYYRYGFWKWRMLRRYPGTLRWRQALPPIFVLSLLVLLLASFWLPVVRWLLAVEVASYLLALSVGTARSAWKAGGWHLLWTVPAAIAVMHVCWGTGFLSSMISAMITTQSESKP